MDEKLRAELLARVNSDQAARRAHDPDTCQWVDAENLPWLRGVIDRHGWPGKSLVGEDGAQAAWLLTQHASADPGFQRRCLDLLTAAVEAGEATRRNLAYLTDRVLLAEGQPQVYGTQVSVRGGAPYEVSELRDPDEVDARRAAAGLGPLAEYLKGFEDFPRPSSRVHCPGCGEWLEFEVPGLGESFTVTCPQCGREMTGTTHRPGG